MGCGIQASGQGYQLSPLNTVTLQVQSECPLPDFYGPHSSTVTGCPEFRDVETVVVWPELGLLVSSGAR